MIELPAGGLSPCSRWFLPFPDELDGYCWCPMGLPFCSMMSVSTVRTVSWRHLYLPWLSADLHPARMCANVPLSLHNLHSGSSLGYHLCRFDGIGRVPYTDRSRKEMRKGSSLHSSAQVTFCLGRSQFVQAPWASSFTALILRPSSSRCQIPTWTMSLLSLPPLLEMGKSKPLSPCAWVPNDVFQFQCSFCLSYCCISSSFPSGPCGDTCAPDPFISEIPVHRHSPTLPPWIIQWLKIERAALMWSWVALHATCGDVCSQLSVFLGPMSWGSHRLSMTTSALAADQVDKARLLTFR